MLTPTSRDMGDLPRERISLHALPYDLLLNIAHSLSLRDIHSLQLTCKSLYEFATTRPVFRNLAVALLRRCRALPLSGFQRLSDLTTEQLITAVTRATRLERAWLTRTPRPSSLSPYTDSPGVEPQNKPWYKIISSPPNEEIDWLSPITSSFSLCATKSGKVVCWDVHRDVCLAEWNPNERWELWKCRVEFDIRTVYFSMAKTLQKMYDDRLMEFILMKLEFPNTTLDSSGRPAAAPVFSRLATFRTMGVVMNVFLLDPAVRLLSAFVWVPGSNTIGLYALLDWDIPEYIFVDTGIECTMSSNWSCILHGDQIVIHSEESDIAYQYFYPIETLRKHSQPSQGTGTWTPSLSSRLMPTITLSGRFIFPSKPFPRPTVPPNVNVAYTPLQTAVLTGLPAVLPPTPPAMMGNGDSTPATNPFPFPPWYPESAHFVRQWWPTLPTIPRLSCTVVLLADHDPVTHRTRYVLAQHYFKVPLSSRRQQHLSGLDLASTQSTDGSLHGGGTTRPSSSNATTSKINGAIGGGGRSSSSSGTGTMSSGSSESEETYDEVDDPRSEGGGDSVFDDDDDDGADIDDDMLRIWYVSKPFEVVCVFDGVDDDPEEGQPMERPRPLMAVDFGHAVWVEYNDEEPNYGATPGASGPGVGTDTDEPGGVLAAAADGLVEEVATPHLNHAHDHGHNANTNNTTELSEAKRLRFVSFPPVVSPRDEPSLDAETLARVRARDVEGMVRTLEIPDELELDSVETINIDQSQGAVIVSVKEGRIFILCYE